MQSFPDSYAALSWLVGEGGPAANDEILHQAFVNAQSALTASEREAALETVSVRLSETLPVIWLLALEGQALASPDVDHVRLSPFGWLEIDTS